MLGAQGTADLVLLATHALRVGALDYAVAISEAYDGPPEPALQVTHAAALFGSGQHARARQLVDEVLGAHPEHLTALFYGSQMAMHAGDSARATELLLQVLSRFPDFPGAHGMLAGLRMPGPPYREVLQRLHEILQPRTYFEIGVETGATLAFAKNAQRAIGVDPDSSKLRRELVPPNARVFHETSDDFFARTTREEMFGEHRIDLGFIDGMHLFEYALRDFINVESWSHPGGVIVLHDCLPIFPLTASRERRSKFWVGDVWKVVSILREYRPELSVKIVLTAPSGLCIVRGLDARSRVLREALPAIIARYQDMPYPSAGIDAPPGFELVPPNAAGLRQALT
jgi:predicted O-methyltransferase YrrM